MRNLDPDFLKAVQSSGLEITADVIGDYLRFYKIGEKLKRLRLRRALGLAELGKHTGLSPAMLSKIENGHVVPTLPTLLRIALVFGVGLEFFFEDELLKRLGVTRQGQRQVFEELSEGQRMAYRFESLDFTAVERKSSAYLATFDAMPPEEVPVHAHAGAEFIYVIQGTLGLMFEQREVVLGSGDSLYMDASYLHGYRRIGGEECRAVVVTVP